MSLKLLEWLHSPALILSFLAAAIAVRKLIVYARLRQFQGPFLASLSELPLAIAIYGNNCHLWYAKVSEKYGPVARIGPKLLLTSSPELWIHANKDKRYKRTDWFYHSVRFAHRKDSIVSQTDNDKHDETRKKLSPGYSGKENLELERSIDQLVSGFIHLLRSKYLSSKDHIIPVDMSAKMQYFTLDIVSRVAFGKAFGMLETDTDINGFIKSTQQGLHIFRIVVATGLHWLIHAPILGRIFTMSPKDEHGFGKILGNVYAAVDARVADHSSNLGRSDMLASFIRNGLAGSELHSEVMTQIMAGSDTTAGALRGIIMHVATNPHCYMKLRQTIDEASVPRHEIISFTKARSLTYMQAVIRESMRILPPGTNLFPRDVPPEGDLAPLGNGKSVYLPGGTQIGISQLTMHRNREVYGEDVEVFRPERWIEPDQSKLERMIRISDLNFSTGRFACLGKPVAQYELSKITFESTPLIKSIQLFRNFDVAFTNPTTPWVAKNYLGLFNITDMWMQVRERDSI